MGVFGGGGCCRCCSRVDGCGGDACCSGEESVFRCCGGIVVVVLDSWEDRGIWEKHFVGGLNTWDVRGVPYVILLTRVAGV